MFAWLVFNNKNKQIESINDYIVRLPGDMEIPEDSIKIHGITNEKMRKEGVNILDVLMEFKKDLSGCDIMVAHNLEFDTNIISVEM